MTMRSFHLVFALLFLAFNLASGYGVNEDCEAETRRIQSYSGLQEELHLALRDGIGGQLNECNYTSDYEFICRVVYTGNNRTLDNYYQMCDRAQGQVIYRELEVNHNFMGMLNFNLTMEEIPQCVGLSCIPITVDSYDLPNPVFDNFIAEAEAEDLCKDGGGPVGELDFWSNIGAIVAGWLGIDLSDCFDAPSSSEEDESRTRHLLLRGKEVDVFDAEGDSIDVDAN